MQGWRASRVCNESECYAWRCSYSVRDFSAFMKAKLIVMKCFISTLNLSECRTRNPVARRLSSDTLASHYTQIWRGTIEIMIEIQ